MFVFPLRIQNLKSHINQPPLGVTLTTSMEKVERIQYQAALAITGAWQGSSRSKLYDELGWESLSDRGRSRRNFQIHKIIDKNTLLLKGQDLLTADHFWLMFFKK